MYLNKVLLYGNLTRDPELRALPSGQQVASFSIATNRTFKNKEGQQQDQTEFHNIVSFGRQAEIIGQYLKKGRAVYIEGRLQTRSWEKDGAKQFRTEVVCETFQFGAQVTTGDRTAARSNEADQTEGNSIEYPEDEINPEDIPF